MVGLREMSDIQGWYAAHKDFCPNCGTNLGQMHPEQNLYPHFTGACKDAEKLALRSRVRVLEEALREIIDIGKRDLTNPKYDGYFESARAALSKVEEPARDLK